MLCGLCDNLSELVLSRVIQGIGGAMMVPVGRLVMLRSVDRSEYVRAMAYLVTFHWGWLLASLLLGLAMGWIAVVQRSDGVSGKMARWLAALAAALVAASVARIVPGRFGYWLDLWLVMFACYLVGCAVGSALRDWEVSRSGLVPPI